MPLARRALLLALAATPTLARPALAAPRAEPWERWRRHASGARTSVDHAAFDALLARHRSLGSDGIARFAYQAARTERETLTAYLARLQATDVDALDRAEQFAFWANLYNALTLDVVLAGWPVASIRDIRSGLFTPGPWGRRLATVAGQALTLDDIEHRILRPLWQDPRVHYAVNCAALGCPDLPARAWRATTLDADLDSAARVFVNHPRGARIERDRLLVSSIYRWFIEDFSGTDAGVIAHLVRFAAPPLAAALRGRQRLDRDAYDWAINAA
jgi:hypothetical protein